MSPILLRPIREQFEHDRVIRQLQGRWRRRYAVGINPGAEQTAPIRITSQEVYPDLLLTSTDRGRRMQTIVEVETAESVNHLEALAQWAHLAKARGAFHLYVPAGAAEVARRLCEDNRINVAEIWTYYSVGSQIQFAMAHRSDAATRAAKNRPRRAAAAAGSTSKKKKASKTKKAAKVKKAAKAEKTSKATKAKKKVKSAKTGGAGARKAKAKAKRSATKPARRTAVKHRR